MEQVMAGGDKRRSGASSHIDGVGSRWHGALEIRRLICEDGLAQEVVAVWRRDGVGGS